MDTVTYLRMRIVELTAREEGCEARAYNKSMQDEAKLLRRQIVALEGQLTRIAKGD